MRIILNTQVKNSLLWFVSLFLFFSWGVGGGGWVGCSHRGIWSFHRFLCILIGEKHREVNQEQVFFLSFCFFCLLCFSTRRRTLYMSWSTRSRPIWMTSARHWKWVHVSNCHLLLFCKNSFFNCRFLQTSYKLLCGKVISSMKAFLSWLEYMLNDFRRKVLILAKHWSES